MLSLAGRTTEDGTVHRRRTDRRRQAMRIWPLRRAAKYLYSAVESGDTEVLAVSLAQEELSNCIIVFT